MISFSTTDLIIILSFFAILIVVGFISSKKVNDSAEGYLLSGRKVGLFLFILTNVSTWYGGILGVGEFTYRYGIVSWFTQGLPYYIFAIIFALLFAKKIRNASLFTIPDKIEESYGTTVSLLSSILVFILVSPAPYLLMTANLFSLIFKTPIIISLIITFLISAAYLFKGGYKTDLYTDAVQFFVMFGGFIIIIIVCYFTLGDFEFIKSNVPASHLKPMGEVSHTYFIVWFLIALWTFTDPGFHQRCYAAKSGKVAVAGIIISIIFWALFDFLTTSTGLYARATLKEISNPVLAYPLLAEKILGPGLKGIFYSALFATIISTLNSFLFLSATTIGKDFIFRYKKKESVLLKKYTLTGLTLTGIISILLAYAIPSVIDLWYMIGSVAIPGLLLLVISSYYPKLKIKNSLAMIELGASTLACIIWIIIRGYFVNYEMIYEIEPMIVGLGVAVSIHLFGVAKH